jgi:Uma2 family endonuclease
VSAAGTGYTRSDLDRFADDGLRRELIDGELFVSPHAWWRHQQVMARLLVQLYAHAQLHGGEAVTEPNLDYDERTHLEPDLVYVKTEHRQRISAHGLVGSPDLVVEISSPSTRAHDLIRKRAVYEREGVPEFWFVDLDHDEVQVYRLDGPGYGQPTVIGRGEMLSTPLLPGLAIDVEQALGGR